MIVIAGKYKGFKLKTLEGMNTRPTSSRVKEDLFNILNNYFVFDGKISLDLFGGTGALSLEGLSRGIKFAYVNDHYQPAIKIIEQNFAKVEESTYQILMKDYQILLNEFAVKKIKVDLIFLDPPFLHIEYYYDFFAKLKDNNLLHQ
jgi:16S rRNA (guanine(966)-N(2))-methyltransferase RsmD